MSDTPSKGPSAGAGVPDGAVHVCPLESIEAGTAAAHEVDSHRLALVRIEDDVYVIGDRCTHQDVSLAEGDVDVKGRTLECWKHGSLFGIDDGAPTCLPATKPVPVYEAVVAEGEVWVVLS